MTSLSQHHAETLVVATSGRGTFDISADVARVVSDANAVDGVCNLFVCHTSASLIVCENADPAVRRDLERFAARLVPDGDDLFEHRDEGPDDMPAHVRSVLTATSLTVPIESGRLGLGTWQGLYLWEHRTAPHRRRVIISVIST